ncbi:quinoprotein dehydrogenase-associated SoxYZ-like carrier [Methylocella tundrae]|uniref:Sulphur oxidation protein SoxZ n=1 Tax=Methylocella tundrae TaxID=227605 RepID=A0A4U8Z2D8_METTU|nr:quinoprotein dehydrogenase-associated SoxYZ-like carrier [Methylocella tundrae]WPP03398.1 quinoprotein dehydrogenase-associated SoxYZ-like carrier [Methylocella tundrae]VFU09450.1 Sulphur oxidation protein SoxZ [Methylocella tundrae]
MRAFFAPRAVASFGFAVAALTAAFMASPPARAAAGDDPAEREARWQDIAKTVFGDRAPKDGAGVIELGTSLRAEDASLVPMTVTLPGKEPIKGMYLIIDDNPSPVAAHFIFGPAADPREIKLRVRVNTYTNVHAIAETADGGLYEAVRFIKAAGGCSAPMGMSNEEAMKDIGDIRLKFPPDAAPGKATQATLMVRHPNFNGMQMDQISRMYTPARYIQSISVTTGDKKVFDLSTDISLASNPVISFGLVPQGEVKIAVDDSNKAHWEKSFPGPQLSN